MNFPRISLILALAALSIGALAQFDNGDSLAQTPAWQQFKLPKKTVSLHFTNASPDMVVQFFSKASGITIVKDPGLTQGISISSAKPVSLSDAFNILNTALDLRGYQMSKQGNLLVIKQKSQRGGAGGFDMSALRNLRGPENVLKVYPIQYANATSVAKVLNEVFSGQTTSTNPFGGGGFGRFIQQFQMGQGGGQNAAQQQQQMHASADDYSNSVIVNAPESIQTQVADLLKSIDKQNAEPYQTKVYKLIYASSDDLAPVVQNVLTANAPTGKGGQNSQNVDIGARFQQALRLGSAQAAFGTVVSEPKTNSLVVTGTPENQTLVAQVISELDKPIKFEDSAVVIPLNNAQAVDVAYVINQAFQSRIANTSSTTFGNYGGSATSNGLNRFSSSGGSTVGRTGGPTGLNLTQQPQANNMAPDANRELQTEQQAVQQALGDSSIDPNSLETNIAVQGGGFFQRALAGQNGSANQTQPQQVRDATGQLVNVHNLNGNVSIIPDANSNSVVVVTNPENMEIVRQIIDQLDKTPPQVMIETIIAEATLDNTDKLGVEWQFMSGKLFGISGSNSTTSQNFGVQSGLTSSGNSTPQTAGGTFTLSAGKLTAFVQALATDTKFRVLETPRIFASNNQMAEINVSQSVPYVVSSQVDVNGNFNYSYSFENVGVVLDVLPTITSNGNVHLQVYQTANELQGYTSFNAPIVNQRSANTVVSVKDGETVVLGGIMGDQKSATVNKIPLLGDIPIIGNLFRSTVKEDTKTELLIFLTPHVIMSSEDAEAIRRQQEKDLSPGNRTDTENIIKQQKHEIPPKEGGL